LRLARLAFSDPELSGLCAFHCQQAAEKALKAFLAWSNEPPFRTHDLPALLDRCLALEPAFVALQPVAETLDVYLTAGRYPDTEPEPSSAEAEEAIQLAEQLLTFVGDRLPRQDQR
jgi:HEPN domain-containing protein